MEKRDKKAPIKGKVPPPRNPIAVASQKRSGAGAGSHKPKKFTRKSKHKGADGAFFVDLKTHKTSLTRFLKVAKLNKV